MQAISIENLVSFINKAANLHNNTLLYRQECLPQPLL